jgi:hypothetical protein
MVNGEVSGTDGKIVPAGTLAAGAGATLDLAEGGTLSIPITGLGTLEIGGTATLAGEALAIATVLIDTGATLTGRGTFDGDVINNGQIVANGGVLTLDSALTGSGALAVGTGATLDLAGGGTLGGAVTGQGKLEIDGTATLTGGTIDTGALDVTTGATFEGTGTIGTNIADAGLVQADGGVLTVDARVTGDGTLSALAGAELKLTASFTLTESVTGSGTLLVGRLADIVLDGALAIADTVVNGTLRLEPGNAVTGSLTVDGTVIAENLTGAPDGASLSGAVTNAGTITANDTQLSVTGLTNQSLVEALNASLITIDGLSGLGTLTADAASTIQLVGTDIIGGKSHGTTVGGIGGDGTLRVGPSSSNAGTGILRDLGAAISIASLDVAQGGFLNGFGSISGTVTDDGLINATGLGTGTLTLTGALSGTGTLAALAGATLELAQSSATTLTETITGGGTLLLDGSYVLPGHVTVYMAHIVLAQGAMLQGGTGTIDGAVTNAGTIEAGGLSFLGAVTNTGVIDVVQGTARFAQAIDGGTVNIGTVGSGTLTLVQGASAGTVVDFVPQAGAASDLLRLGNALSFAAGISDFGQGDAIDLIKQSFTSYNFSNGVLNIVDDHVTVASLNFTGNYTSASFLVTHDGAGGTLIQFA